MQNREGRRTEQLNPQADPQGQRNSFAEERREKDEANCCNEPRNTRLNESSRYAPERQNRATKLSEKDAVGTVKAAKLYMIESLVTQSTHYIVILEYSQSRTHDNNLKTNAASPMRTLPLLRTDHRTRWKVG